MSDTLIPVRPEWKERAYIDAKTYEGWYLDSIANPNGFWGEEGPQARMDQALHPSEGHLLRPPQFPHPLVRRRHAQRLGQLHRPPPACARQPDRDHLGGRRPHAIAPHHLRRTASGGLPLRQRAQGQRRAQRRPRHDLPADDSRSRLRHARLRADRRDPLRRLRGLLARQSRGPHPRLRQRSRRSPPTKASAAANPFRSSATPMSPSPNAPTSSASSSSSAPAPRS
jgi:hypothetical protein